MRELLNSKKFVAALVGVVGGVAMRMGIPEVKLDEILALISPILVYIGAQGFADVGKEKARIEAESKP